jgi:hypothetical protein
VYDCVAFRKLTVLAEHGRSEELVDDNDGVQVSVVAEPTHDIEGITHHDGDCFSVAVGRNDLCRQGSDRRDVLERDDAGGAGVGGHDGEEADACAHVDHGDVGCEGRDGAGDGIVVFVVALPVVNHGPVPRSNWTRRHGKAVAVGHAVSVGPEGGGRGGWGGGGRTGADEEVEEEGRKGVGAGEGHAVNVENRRVTLKPR